MISKKKKRMSVVGEFEEKERGLEKKKVEGWGWGECWRRRKLGSGEELIEEEIGFLILLN